MFTSRRIWIPLSAAALALAALSAHAQDITYSAKLTGAAQLPEPTNSKAMGDFAVVVSADGKKVSYKLSVTDLQNPTGADLHLGQPTANGPSVVKLFPIHGTTPKKGSFTGVLAEGTITAADLTGPMKGGTLADLVDEIREGETYVNVHTDDGAPPQDTGPGDYHLGEIRGQIK
jgi:hypothetical protein